MMRDILLVTGVSASGKDFLLEKAKQHDARIGEEIPLVNAGSAIAARINQQANGQGELDRDRMKHLITNDTMRQAVRSLVAELVQYPAAIVNGHITYRQQGELVSNPDIDAEISPAAYAVVVAEPVDIVMWRSSETSRNRELETLDQIAYHQEFTIEAAERMAAVLGVESRIIENNSSNADSSSLVLATMVNNICPE